MEQERPTPSTPHLNCWPPSSAGVTGSMLLRGTKAQGSLWSGMDDRTGLFSHRRTRSPGPGPVTCVHRPGQALPEQDWREDAANWEMAGAAGAHQESRPRLWGLSF